MSLSEYLTSVVSRIAAVESKLGLSSPTTNVPADKPKAAAATTVTSVDLAAELGKIDQSSGKTAGMREVTKDMKAKAATGKITEVEHKKPLAKKWGATTKELVPKFEKKGNKWVVEEISETKDIPADEVTTKDSVYIYGCVGATIVVNGKCNTITIDSCQKTQVVFDDVLATCEVVNSKNVKVQCRGKTPTMAVDKTDGIVIYLSKDTMFETCITASKSSEMNVSFPGETDDDAWGEAVLPEQFTYKISADRKIESEVSELYAN